MHFEANTLDDLLRRVFKTLLSLDFNINPTRSKDYGPTSEIVGASLKLLNPRARLSRTESKGTIFSALGELLWYLSGSDDLSLITHYIKRYRHESKDGRTVYGAYGPRLFNLDGKVNQIQNIIELLNNNPDTRKAVIQLYSGQDLIKGQGQVPCTCTLQFLLRSGKLHMTTYMRSNDAFIGLPHDLFAFTMLQEIIARSLGNDIQLGEYIHFVGSLHLYQKNKPVAERFIEEGFQSTNLIMPAMPKQNPWKSVDQLLRLEKELRESDSNKVEAGQLHSYWRDLFLLLKIHSIVDREESKSKVYDLIQELKTEFSTTIFNIYIQKRLLKLKNIEKGD